MPKAKGETWRQTGSWRARGLSGHVVSSAHLALCCLTLISKRSFIFHLGSLQTCGIWEAVQATLPWGSRSFGGAETELPVTATVLSGMLRNLPTRKQVRLSAQCGRCCPSEQNVTPEETPTEPAPHPCNKILSWYCSCSGSGKVLTD